LFARQYDGTIFSLAESFCKPYEQIRYCDMIKLKDPISGLTHCAGIILAITGLVFLIWESTNPVKPMHIVTFCVFGAGMILLYTASTLYHWLPVSEKMTQRLRKIDHIMIFILIAATYTPICLIPLRGAWGWSLFGVIWGLTAVGIIMKLFWIEAPRWLYTLIYIATGWLAIVAIWPLAKTLHVGGMTWLFIGGLFYTAGAVIYAIKRPNPWPRVIGFHEIFHVFVMMGTFSHFWLMYRYITPLS